MNVETQCPSVDALAVEAVRARLTPMLQDPAQFQAFAADPQAFAARNGLQLDASFLEALRQRLSGVASYEEAQRVERPLSMAASSNPAAANQRPLQDNQPKGPPTNTPGQGTPPQPSRPS